MSVFYSLLLLLKILQNMMKKTTEKKIVGQNDLRLYLSNNNQSLTEKSNIHQRNKVTFIFFSVFLVCRFNIMFLLIVLSTIDQ
jgi:hypothetical protein